MEEEYTAQPQSEEQEERYVPRPRWQIVMAWMGLALFEVVLVMYYLTLFRGAA